MPKLTKEEKGRLADRLFELYRVTGNGTRNLAIVEQGIQELIEGAYPRGLLVAESHQEYDASPPSWWRTPEQQLERARELWPDAVLPEPPKVFTPRTSTEVLLLHVPEGADSLWSTFHKHQERLVVQSPNIELERVRGIEYTMPAWLGFDPEHGKGQSLNFFPLGQNRVAVVEVFSAMIQFPGWVSSWLNGVASVPNLSGYAFKSLDEWLILGLGSYDNGRGLMLETRLSDSKDPQWASPAVREC